MMAALTHLRRASTGDAQDRDYAWLLAGAIADTEADAPAIFRRYEVLASATIALHWDAIGRMADWRLAVMRGRDAAPPKESPMLTRAAAIAKIDRLLDQQLSRFLTALLLKVERHEIDLDDAVAAHHAAIDQRAEARRTALAELDAFGAEPD